MLWIESLSWCNGATEAAQRSSKVSSPNPHPKLPLLASRAIERRLNGIKLVFANTWCLRRRLLVVVHPLRRSARLGMNHLSRAVGCEGKKLMGRSAVQVGSEALFGVRSERI